MGSTLVTGVNGLIGFALAKRLRALGENVIGMDRVLHDARQLDLPLIEADLSDTHRLHSALREHAVERIVHAGGISGPMLLQDDPHQVFTINVVGTLNIAEAARIHGVDRMVFLSSYVAYGEQPDDTVVSEDRALRATTPYAASKIAGEAIVRSYREHYGLEGVSLRLGVVYGPRRTTTCLVRLMLENALDGTATRLDFGAGWRRPFVHVDDTVDAVCRALATPFTQIQEHAYNVAGGVWSSIDEIAGEVADSVPDIELDLAPGRGPLDSLVGPLDLTAIKRDLGYSPCVTLADGVARYYAWLKEQRKS